MKFIGRVSLEMSVLHDAEGKCAQGPVLGPRGKWLDCDQHEDRPDAYSPSTNAGFGKSQGL